MGSASGDGTPAESTGGWLAHRGLPGPRTVDAKSTFADEASVQGEARRLSLLFPASPDRLSELRRGLKRFLRAHGVSDGDLFDLLVVVSEAVANAIEHPVCPTEPLIRIVVEIHGDRVEVIVRDSGTWRQPTQSVARGRGLMLIGALADVDVRRDPNGTTLSLCRRLVRPVG